jgi:hypothetical protein
MALYSKVDDPMLYVMTLIWLVLTACQGVGAAITAWLLRQGRRRKALISAAVACIPLAITVGGLFFVVGGLGALYLWTGWWYYRIEDEEWAPA